MPQPGQDIHELSAADRQAIEKEHARLELFLRDLNDVCNELESEADERNGARERVAAYQGRLNSFFYDFLDLVSEHFENEEKIMRDGLQPLDNNEHFHLHQMEHAKLIREIKSLMRASSELKQAENPAEAVRQLYQGISAKFVEHARFFDYALLQALKPHQ